MEEIRLSYSEAFWYAMIPVAVGFTLGLVPFVAGYVRGKLKLGSIGLAVSTIGGAIFGAILSIPAMAIFTWLILRDQFVPAEPSENDTGGEESPEN